MRQFIAKEKPKKEEERKWKNLDDFDGELKGKKVIIYFSNGQSLEGTIEAYSRFWYLLTNSNKKFYVHKAWIAYIQPE